MANNNDFLSQFSDENYKKQEVVQPTPAPRQEKKETIKPKQAPKVEAQKVNSEPASSPRLESFKEENRTKIQKAPINPLVIIIPCIVVLLIAAILIYIFVFPHIEVENFIGKTKDDMSAWVKQQDIDTTGIIIKEEYNFDADEGIILDQDPVSGKVKKDAKMTFTVSKGADPDESIEVPDLETMTKSEIEAWVKENKLSNTKVSTAYDDTVAEGELVSITYGTNVDSSNFTRGSSLKIVFSKGQKPADKVTVSDFSKQSYSTVEEWGKKNKINITKTEQYSDDIDKGLVISQSIDANKKVDQNSTLNVVISKGKEIKMIDLIGKTASEAQKWLTKSGLTSDNYEIKYRYNEADANTVYEQNYEVGKTMNDVEDLKIYVSNGNVVNGSNVGFTSATTYDELVSIASSLKGANITIKEGTNSVYSETLKKGTIISSDKDLSGNFSIGSTITVTVSAGIKKNLTLTNCGYNATNKTFNTSKLIDCLSTGAGTSLDLDITLSTSEATCKLYIDNKLVESESPEYIEGEKIELQSGQTQGE